MQVETPSIPSWLQWEKHKHRALVGLAILASAGMAAAASNERRLFLLPNLPMAFTAIPAPEPTSLRSAVMGYLNDGCVTDVEGQTGGFGRAIDSSDCGRGRKREKKVAPPAPPIEPAAFLAVPDDPMPFDSPLLVIADLPIEPVNLASFGRSSTVPFRPGSSVTPTALVGTAVPEPATWGLMIGGFALAGAALRRRVVREAAPQA